MLQFHSFRLDTVNHCLWRGENREAITPKAFDVLRYLVEHAERLVAQEELLEALWPETYVNPEVIKKYILGIRKVLGDRHEKPEFIRTFPRRGYQFIAPVSGVGADESLALCVNRPNEMTVQRTALEQLGGDIERALMLRQEFVFAEGEARTGEISRIVQRPQSATRRPAIVIVFVTDGGANPISRQQA